MLYGYPTAYKLAGMCSLQQHNILNRWGEISTAEGDMSRHFGQKY